MAPPTRPRAFLLRFFDNYRLWRRLLGRAETCRVAWRMSFVSIQRPDW
jgi:hypothetical protein